VDSPRVHITVYGCQMNRLDGELVAEVLRRSGAEIVADAEAADVLLYVTCAVRGHAENRVFSNLGALAARKKREPRLVVGLLGCMAQEHGAKMRERAPVVDIVCAPGRLAELPDLVARARAGKPAIALDPVRGSDANAGPTASGEQARRLHVSTLTFTPRSALRTPQFAASDKALDDIEIDRLVGPALRAQAYVVAMRGCDNFCSYCVVPYVRGPERSRDPQSILQEVRRLVGKGALEITLLGQAVDRYRAESGGRTWDLADLLAAAAGTPGLRRLRFITSHPAAMTAPLARVFRDVPRVCPHLHMPAQSGSDAVLERMNRGYTAAEYLEKVALVREACPEVAVVSDFIVGFPGESHRDFDATMDLARRVRFAGGFVFKYSPRPGTSGAKRFADDVPAAEKRRRNNELLALISQISEEENRRFIGRRVSVLVEGLAPRPHLNKREASPASGEASGEQAPRQNVSVLPFTPHSALSSSLSLRAEGRTPHSLQFRGRTPCNRLVVLDGPPDLIGREVDADILDAGALTLFGKLA